MALFSYQGRRQDTGELVQGSMESASHVQLGQDLLQQGVLLTKFEMKKKKQRGLFFASLTKHVPLLEKVLFARYFALMLRAGLDVKQALEALAEQTRNKNLQASLKGVSESVSRGTTLADSMASHPGTFSELFVSFVRVGESSGRLQESLEILSSQLQKEYDLKRAVRGALLYPIIILVALTAVGFAMLVFVVPKLAEVFRGFDVDLPLLTRILLGIGDFSAKYWWLLLIGMAGTVVGGWFLWKVKKIKDRFMHIILYLWIIGPIVRQVNLARFTRSLSSLLSSGVSFVEAVGILSTNTPHASYANSFGQAQEFVKQGKLLSEYLEKKRRLFPPLVVNVIRVGEETGSLDQVLKEIALFYEAEVDQVMKNLTSIMEPVLMIVIGLAVGALAISVISPIYNLVNVI